MRGNPEPGASGRRETPVGGENPAPHPRALPRHGDAVGGSRETPVGAGPNPKQAPTPRQSRSMWNWSTVMPKGELSINVA